MRAIMKPGILAPGRYLPFVLVPLIVGPCQAADWRGSLHEGAPLEVDPSTRRAWRLDGGARTPLWDGVHRLDDGSVLIVRDGVVVPNAGMLETWDRPPGEAAALPVPESCRELVRRVCGEDGRCGAAEPCRLARELSDMAKEASSRGEDARAPGSTAASCREALGNGFFVPCD